MAHFVLNPITNRLDLTDTGTGPSGDIVITPDSGADLSGDAFDMLGTVVGASLTPATETYNDGGIFRIADQTYYTPYVVDPSSTIGEKGTYTTIQDAIDAGFTDSGNSSFFTVFVRDGQYTENLTISSLCWVQIVGLHSQGRLNPNSAWLDGSITMNTNCRLEMYNFRLQSSGTGISSAVGSQLNLTDCFISAATGTGVNLTSTSTNTFSATNCYLDGITVTSGSTSNFQTCGRLVDCVITAAVVMDSTSRLKFMNCMIAGTTLTNTAAILAESCEFTATLSGSSTGTSELYNCVYRGSTPFINYSGTVIYSNLTTVGSGVLLSSSGTFQLQRSTQGNILQSVTTATDYTVNFYDYYVGITDTSSVWTMTLPAASSVPDQMFIFKDQSGGAGTNNIALTPASGNINGGASYSINTNYGFASVKSDGTNYWVI